MTGRASHGFERKGSKAILLLLLLLGPSSWSVAQEASRFYEGKTIQFLVSSGPGATTDITARLVARYLGKHIPGRPGIVVQNMPGGGGLVGANYLYNVSKPDGLTILAVSRANYLDQMVGRPEVKANFRKFSWIGSFNKATIMGACRSDTPLDWDGTTYLSGEQLHRKIEATVTQPPDVLKRVKEILEAP
jgi:tripartite-type tricarboxylate transporter receptor subunit TctC